VEKEGKISITVVGKILLFTLEKLDMKQPNVLKHINKNRICSLYLIHVSNNLAQTSTSSMHKLFFGGQTRMTRNMKFAQE
jgi:hypothetical protein